MENCNIVIISSGNKCHDTYCVGMLEFQTDKKVSLNGIQQHLYFTSDGEIKDGDYSVGDEGVFGPYEDGDTLPNNSKKIIATTDTSLDLPSIPQQFIQYYIEEYNKGNVIDKAQVEYTDLYLSVNYTSSLMINTDNTINVKPIKDSWSRDEVMKLLLDFNNDKPGIFDCNQWVKENL